VPMRQRGQLSRGVAGQKRQDGQAMEHGNNSFPVNKSIPPCGV
jgi:hypothetical protein